MISARSKSEESIIRKCIFKNTYPRLHHDLNGDNCGPVEVGEDVDIGKEDSRVELEQEFCEKHTKD